MKYISISFMLIIIIFNFSNLYGNDLKNIKLEDLYFEISISDLTNNISVINEYTNSFISLKKHDYLNGERRLEKIFDSELSPVSNLLGVSLILKGEYKNSTIYFENAIRLNPKNLNSFLNLGMVYIHYKEWKKLRELSIILQKRLPETGDGQLGEGIALYHEHRFKASLKKLKSAQKLMRLNNNPRIDIVNEYIQRAGSIRRNFFNFGK